MRPTQKVIIERQIAQWEKRVWIPDAMPERTVDKDGNLVLVDNEKFNKIFENSKKFSCLYAENKEDIYKFLRYGIEKGKVYNSNITFSRKGLYETYIAPDENLKDSYRLIQELIKVIPPANSSIQNKWIVCESLDCDFNDKIATYFITQLIINKAIGIIFSCDKNLPNNFLSCLISGQIVDIQNISN